MRKYSLLLVKNKKAPYLALTLVVVACGLCVWLASRLSISTDLSLLLPEHAPIIQRMNTVLERIGTTGEVVVQIDSPSKEANIKFMEAAAPVLEDLPDVMFVHYHQDRTFFEDNALLYLSEDKLKEIEGEVRERIGSEVGKRMNLFGDDDGEGSNNGVAGNAGDGNNSGKKSDGEEKLAGTLFKGEDLPWANYNIDEYFLNHDGTTAVMKVQPNGPPIDVDFCRQLLDSMQAAMASLQPTSFHPEMKFKFQGDYVQKLGELDSVKDDVALASSLCMVVIALCIIVFFRTFRSVVLIMIPLWVGALWTLGFASLAVGRLNVISAFIVAILLGLGIDIGIHFYSRFLVEAKKGASLEDALVAILSRTGRAALTAAFTTAATFFMLVFADFRGFSEFGLIASGGILLSYVAVYATFPALLVLLERFWPSKARGKAADAGTDADAAADSRVEKGASVPKLAKHRRPFPLAASIVVLIAGIGFAVYGAASFDKIPFEFDFGKLTRKSESREVKEKAAKQMKKANKESYSDILGNATFPNAIALADSWDEAKLLHRALEAQTKVIDPENGKPYLPRFLTIWHFVPEQADQEARLKIIKRIKRLVDRKMDILSGDDLERVNELYSFLEVEKTFGIEDLPHWVKKRFGEVDGESFGKFAMLWGWGKKEDYLTASKLFKAFGDITLENGKVVPVTANYFILKDVVDMAASDGVKVMILAVISVFLLLLADFRSWKKTFLSFGTITTGFLWAIAIFYLADVKWSFFNLCILPTVIGMGIDYAIHFMHRYYEEGRGSIGFVLKHSGLPLILTSVTTVAGFVGMMLADHYGLNSLGTVAVTGLAAACAATLIVLPALLAIDERLAARREKRLVAANNPS